MDEERTAQNTYINAMLPATITRIVEGWFTGLYTRSNKGRRSAEQSKLKHPTQYLVTRRKDGLLHLIANPYAFSWTKGFMKGYPTVPVEREDVPGVVAPPSTSKKSTWHPRVPVHALLWRYFNGFKQIPAGMDVSHVTDQPLLVTPGYLVLETGPSNRARIACRLHRWYDERVNLEDGTVRLRCPHWDALCEPGVALPTVEEFASPSLNEPPGLLLLKDFCVPSSVINVNT